MHIHIKVNYLIIIKTSLLVVKYKWYACDLLFLHKDKKILKMSVVNEVFYGIITR